MKKILLVDDNEYILKLLTQEFEEDGYQISTATNGKDALILLKNNPEKPDLVIMDLRMPGMDGLETVGFMVKLKFDLPVIIFSAYSSYRSDPLAMVADAYLMKSSDLSELKNKVYELL